MNALCSRFDILGKKTSLPLVIFCLLSVFLIPNLSYAHLVYCAVWLVVFFLAFNRGESQSKSINYMIYLGITLGIAQTVENTSVLLLVPTFILFGQTGPINARAYVTCFLYFFMVLLGYSGILYVMELDENLYRLIPSIQLDYAVFNTVLLKVLMPYVLVLVIFHFLNLGNYKFRYPNVTRFLNQSMLIQLVIAALLILFTAQDVYLPYVLLPVAILLSFAFRYKQSTAYANAGFAVLIVLGVGALWMHNYLIL